MSQAFRVLRVDFASRDELVREFRTNLANGGLFVPGHFDLLYGEPVLVLIELPFADASFDVEGRVVQVIPVEFEENGAQCGVAVELEGDAADLRERLEAALGERLADEVDSGRGGRVAPRSIALVRARVIVPGVNEIEGRTRNLSLAGVLIAISDEPPPIGQEVEVSIVHPTTGDERAIPGMVARHDLDDRGHVRGIGVQFAVPEESAATTISFINRVKASEHARRLGGISGSIETLGLEDLLMSLSQCVPAGRFTLMKAGEIGTVHVREGRMIAAQVGVATGVKALVRMVAWQGGSFEFHANIEPEEGAATMAMPIEAALLESARLIDESARVRSMGLSPSATIRIDHRKIDLDDPSLDKLEARILDLAGSGMPIGRLLDTIAEPDGVIERAVLDLTERGAIELDDAESEA